MRCYHQIMHAYCISSVIRARRASSNGARCQISISDRARIKIISDSGKKQSISSYLREQKHFLDGIHSLSGKSNSFSKPFQKVFQSFQYLCKKLSRHLNTFSMSCSQSVLNSAFPLRPENNPFAKCQMIYWQI